MIIGFDASRINKSQKTGVENYSTQLLHWFKKFDHKNNYILYTTKAQDEELKDLPGNFTIREIPLRILWTQFRFALELLRDRLDLVFISSHVSPFLNFKRTIVTIHDIAFRKFPESYPLFQRLYLDLTTRHSVKMASKIITISESTKKDLIKYYGADENKIFVTYLAYEKAGDKIEKYDDEKVKKDLGITKDFIFYLGRIENKKNISNLVRAFYEVLSSGSDIQLILAGKRGYGWEGIKKTIKDFNLEDRVVLPGYISEEEKDFLFKNALCFTFPSLYEGFGIPVLEAMSYGLPCVLSDIPVFKELFADQAIIVDKTDSYKISQGILGVLNNKKLRESLSQKGKKRVKDFSWEKCARETLKVLNES